MTPETPEPIDTAPPTSDVVKHSADLKDTAPCGCVRAVVKRMAPKFHTNPDEPEKLGTAMFNEDGTLAMEEVEEVQERYCGEHSGKLHDAMQHIQKALASGADQNELIRMLSGAVPFAPLSLPAPLDDGDEDEGA